LKLGLRSINERMGTLLRLRDVAVAVSRAQTPLIEMVAGEGSDDTAIGVAWERLARHGSKAPLAERTPSRVGSSQGGEERAALCGDAPRDAIF